MADPISRRRLAAVLGMMGSVHDGEALNAARQAEWMRRQAGLTWDNLLASTCPEPQLTPGAPPWRHLTSICWHSRDRLTEWGLAFLTVVSRQPRLSPKQFKILVGIAGRMGP